MVHGVAVRSLEADLGREVGVAVEDIGLAVFVRHLLVDHSAVEGIEDQLRAIPLLREVSAAVGVSLNLTIDSVLEVLGVVESVCAFCLFAHEVELVYLAVHDVDRHLDGACHRARALAVLDRHASALDAAVVVVADAGVIPLELVAVKGVGRRIDIGVFALRIVGAVRVVTIDLAGSAVRPGFALELGIARSVHALCRAGVFPEFAREDEHAVDEDGDGASDRRLVHAPQRSERLAVLLHVLVRREVLMLVVEVAVCDVGGDVVRGRLPPSL